MTHLLDQAQIVEMLSTYGYWAIFVIVALESSGLPLPGETILIGAAVYAGQSGRVSIELIILAAAAGAILGDNMGYWIGRRFGTRMLERHGRLVGLGPEKLRLGQYLFMRFGGWVVFLGRFVTLLRIFAAVLAGANRFDPRRFFIFNAAGGILWALVFGLGGFFLSVNVTKIEGPFGVAAMLGAIVGVFWLWRFYKTNERRVLQDAKAAFSERPPAPQDKKA